MQTQQDIYRDVEETLGHVPEFIKALPPQAADGFWSAMKNFEMGETEIPMKYKDLIGLAVAATIPCSYCVHFHKEAARLHGASEREMQEAVAMAASTRQGSAILNGLQQDLGQFKEEVREIVRHVQSQQQGPPQRRAAH